MLALACRSSAPADSLPPPGHVTEWPSLVAAAERGDLATVKVMARDVSLGAVPDDHPAAAELGAALGYLQIADDPADLLETMREAEAACEACHRDRR